MSRERSFPLMQVPERRSAERLTEVLYISWAFCTIADGLDWAMSAHSTYVSEQRYLAQSQQLLASSAVYAP